MTRRSTTFSLAGILLLGCLTFPLTSLAQSEFWTGSRTLFGTDPQLSEARHALERGHDARALRYARNVLRHSVRSHDRMNSYSILCIVYRERGELEASLQACDHALRLMRGDNWRVHANRAQTLLHLTQGQWSWFVWPQTLGFAPMLWKALVEAVHLSQQRNKPKSH